MITDPQAVRRAAEDIAEWYGFDEAERQLQHRIAVMAPNREQERNAVLSALGALRRRHAECDFYRSVVKRRPVATDGGEAR